MITDFVYTFTKLLKLSPFSFDDFVSSLLYDSVKGDIHTISLPPPEFHSTSRIFCSLIGELLCCLLNLIAKDCPPSYFEEFQDIQVDPSDLLLGERETEDSQKKCEAIPKNNVSSTKT
eukprot:Sdes_comp16590_c0_seq1m5904